MVYSIVWEALILIVALKFYDTSESSGILVIAQTAGSLEVWVRTGLMPELRSGTQELLLYGLYRIVARLEKVTSS